MVAMFNKKCLGQLVLSVFSSGLIYPISLHWFINTQVINKITHT